MCLNVIFYGFYHGKSPSFTTIWESIFYFFQASNKQIQGHVYLGGGFKFKFVLLFLHVPVEMIQFDSHIFQVWVTQPPTMDIILHSWATWESPAVREATYPIPSMGLVYLPTFTIKINQL